jgi:hypothetical protein
MDEIKFKEKILSKINESIERQKVKIKTFDILENRDRYFLVTGMNGDNRKKKMLFLRYDDWFFYVPGLSSIPPEPERREYIDKVRTVYKDTGITPEERERIKKEEQESIIKSLAKAIQRERI